MDLRRRQFLNMVAGTPIAAAIASTVPARIATPRPKPISFNPELVDPDLARRILSAVAAARTAVDMPLLRRRSVQLQLRRITPTLHSRKPAMKTFDQALETVCVKRATPEEANAALDATEVHERYSELIAEAEQNDMLGAYLTTIVWSVANGHMTLKQAIGASFINGLIVGIEMEKQQG